MCDSAVQRTYPTKIPSCGGLQRGLAWEVRIEIEIETNHATQNGKNWAVPSICKEFNTT